MEERQQFLKNVKIIFTVFKRRIEVSTFSLTFAVQWKNVLKQTFQEPIAKIRAEIIPAITLRVIQSICFTQILTEEKNHILWPFIAEIWSSQRAVTQKTFCLAFWDYNEVNTAVRQICPHEKMTFFPSFFSHGWELEFKGKKKKKRMIKGELNFSRPNKKLFL